MPTAIASDSARQRWTRSRLRSPEIQGESPGAVEVRPSRDIASFRVDQRQPGPCVLAEGLVEQPRRGRRLARGELDLDPTVAQDAGPAPRSLLAGIVRGDHDPRDPSLEDRLHARRLPPLCARRAPASRTSSPPPGPPPARDSRQEPPAQHAVRPVQHETPRRSHPHHAPRQLRRADWGSPAPARPQRAPALAARCPRSVPVSCEFIDRLTSQSHKLTPAVRRVTAPGQSQP